MSSRASISILDYGMGNLRSVAKAVDRAGGEALITSADALGDALAGRAGTRIGD